jgi:protease-4
VVVDGSITDGENRDVPILNIHTTGARTVVAAIRRMAEDPTVAAIVLRIDSPGGSASASDRIWRAVRRARRHKPVVASMGAVAASGGYYVASAADEIVADPSTLTGSIGIFFGKVDFAELASRLGVGVEQLARGRRAGATSLFRPFTDDEREALRAQITYFYRLFLRRVATGRGMTPEEVDALGQGHIYSGDRALRLHLVDRLGGFVTAVARARSLADLPPDAEMIFAPSRPHGLMGYLLNSGNQSAELDTPLSGVLTSLGSLVDGFEGLDGMHPQARLPFVLTPP